MRTTLTLDDDVAVQLNRLRREQGTGLRGLVNNAMRLGLQQLAHPPRAQTPHATRSVALGRCLIGQIDDVSEALAVAEGDRYR